MLYSLSCLSTRRLIVPLEAANNFVMDARLALSATSTMAKPDSELEEEGTLVLVDVEKELEMPIGAELLAPSLGRGGAAAAGAPDETTGLSVAEIVSSKELSLVRFMIQPSILRNSFSSLTFCHETLSVLDETASTITSSGWPGSVVTPSATPGRD